MASGYGLVFPQCNSSGVLTTSAEMKAVAGAKVADVVAAVQAYQGTTGFTRSTLVTLMAGQNDILAAYADWVAGTLTRTQATARVAAAGKRWARWSTPSPPRQRGPGALRHAARHRLLAVRCVRVVSAGSEDRRTMLRELTAAFVEALRLAVTNDGAYAALITAPAYRQHGHEHQPFRLLADQQHRGGLHRHAADLVHRGDAGVGCRVQRHHHLGRRQVPGPNWQPGSAAPR